MDVFDRLRGYKYRDMLKWGSRTVDFKIHFDLFIKDTLIHGILKMVIMLRGFLHTYTTFHTG